MIDTHSHIYGEEYDDDREAVVKSALEAGVESVMLANVDTATIDRMKRMHSEYADWTYMAMGLHPTSVTESFQSDLLLIDSELRSGAYKAVGEVGIDLYWDTAYKDLQIKAFECHVEMALSYGLPLIIHTRKAFAELFASLKRFHGKELHGVFHCFGGGIEEAKKAISIGFYLGIGGVVTYKNSSLPDVLSKVSLDSLVLETDAPYLAPVPYRGKRNEPAYMASVRDRIASIYSVTAQKVDETTTKNAKELFKLE